MSDLRLNTTNATINTYIVNVAAGLTGVQAFTLILNGVAYQTSANAAAGNAVILTALGAAVTGAPGGSPFSATLAGSSLAIGAVNPLYPVSAAVSSNLTLAQFSSAPGDLLLTSTVDLEVPAPGPGAILQDIIQRISTFYGEWFMDTSAGIDWFGQILVKNPDQKSIDAMLIATILGTPGVLTLDAYSFAPDFSRRSLGIIFSCTVSGGVVDYRGTIGS
jgi:hypothetical protein